MSLSASWLAVFSLAQEHPIPRASPATPNPAAFIQPQKPLYYSFKNYIAIVCFLICLSQEIIEFLGKDHALFTIIFLVPSTVADMK